MSIPQVVKIRRKMRRLIRENGMQGLVEVPKSSMGWEFKLNVVGAEDKLFSIEDFIRGRLKKQEPIHTSELAAQMPRFLKQIYFARAGNLIFLGRTANTPAVSARSSLIFITNYEGCP